MKFRRRSPSDATPNPDELDGTAPDTIEGPDGTVMVRLGPYDVDDIPAEMAAIDRVDLGSILVAPVPNCELRLQVDERTQEVQAVLLTSDEGALELRAFAAPRNGDLWATVRPQLAQDIVNRGGEVSEIEGTWGIHLVGQMPVQLPDGTQGVQASRIIGINGSRWMLRATLIGRPAVDGDYANIWLQGLAASAIRRGDAALPVGEALPLVMPPQPAPTTEA
ncbi:DUF3710 domain-containing protein [Nocardioides sp. Kera G14]|uniref:DUF3710 domain-containing protein n=1 Tax=Nocardioides sp. Kera G14 TaxID=2884264 RepID=UPI001D1237EF|nr:DUF3710 domain-containing protein [Nocardioides sp. Kera G14]UDY22363.1 DUF3710 domain-containing protein [Nocardioides sp. Kera G14]